MWVCVIPHRLAGLKSASAAGFLNWKNYWLELTPHPARQQRLPLHPRPLRHRDAHHRGARPRSSSSRRPVLNVAVARISQGSHHPWRRDGTRRSSGNLCAPRIILLWGNNRRAGSRVRRMSGEWLARSCPSPGGSRSKASRLGSGRLVPRPPASPSRFPDRRPHPAQPPLAPRHPRLPAAAPKCAVWVPN